MSLLFEEKKMAEKEELRLETTTSTTGVISKLEEVAKMRILARERVIRRAAAGGGK